MSKYLNDPREDVLRIDSGVGYYLEEDKREENENGENWYKWGAKVLDLCNLPVDEYMKPMTVNCNGGGSGPDGGDDTGSSITKKSVAMVVEIIDPNGNIIGPNGDAIGKTDSTGEWVSRWSWSGGFPSYLVGYVTVVDGNSQEHNVSATISDNEGKKTSTEIQGVTNGISSISSYGISDGESADATGKTVTIIDGDTNTQYTIKVTLNSKSQAVDYDIYYCAESKSVSTDVNDLNLISFDDAMDADGADFTITIPISNEYAEEAEKFDNGEYPYDGDDSEDVWNEWVDNYENENRYTVRIYVPETIVDSYNYELYNSNAGILSRAEMVDTGNVLTKNNEDYREFVNANSMYLYDDSIGMFLLNIKIREK